MDINKESRAVVHEFHYMHHDEADTKQREISINNSVLTISLASSDPDEDIDFLCSKALEILRQMKQEGNR
jgi:hypothetical protein